MPVTDTSFLAAVFDEEHPQHKQARRRAKGGAILHATEGVIGELTTLVRRRADDEGLDGEGIARDVLSRLEALSTFRHAGLGEPTEAARIYRNHRGISYVDACAIALALELREPLYTFDRRQSRVARREQASG